MCAIFVNLSANNYKLRYECNSYSIVETKELVGVKISPAAKAVKR